MAAQPPSPTWVGEQFISKYYDVLAKLPKHLHRFYKENSTFSVADVQPDGHAVVGTATGTLEDIQEKVMSTVANAVVDSDMSLDAQFSQGNGVLLHVSGTMTLQGVHRKFVQVFFLATQEKGYYVLNDMLRILPPEAPRDTRPVENGFVGQPAIPAAAFGLVPPQLPGQLPPRVEMAPAMAPSAPVPPPAVPVQQLSSEAEAIGPEKPVAATAAQPAPPIAPSSPPPGAAPAPALASTAQPAAPATVTPALTPAAQAATAVQPAPTAPPAPKQVTAPQAASSAAAAGPSAPSAAAPAPTASLSWAARAALAPSAVSASKPVTPAKAPSPPAPALAPEVPTVDGSAAPAAVPAVAAADADALAEPTEVEARAPDVLPEPVAGGSESHPGFGVYVQGIPQTGDIQKLLMTEFAQFGPFGPSGVNVIRSPRYGMVAYIFYQDEKSRDAAREANGKLRLPDSDKPVKILGMLPEFERGFAPRGGGRGERGRGSGMGGYRSGRGGFDGSRGRGGRGEGGRGDRPMGGPGGRGGRGGDRGGRGGGSGRVPRDSNSGPAGPKQG